MTLDQSGGVWKAEVILNLADEDVKPVMKELKVSASKIETIYDFEAQGLTLQQQVRGRMERHCVRRDLSNDRA